jgi:hypothetical protein
MELITILNRCYRQKGFVYRNASFVGQDHHEIEVSIVPRKHTRANCSGCGKPCPGYDRHNRNSRVSGKKRLIVITTWAQTRPLAHQFAIG